MVKYAAIEIMTKAENNTGKENNVKMQNISDKKYTPGDGIRSLQSSPMFRAVNFELYAKPNNVVMALGILAMTGCMGYILYMRSKYESMGFYSAVEADGTETFKKKVSKWTV